MSRYDGKLKADEKYELRQIHSDEKRVRNVHLQITLYHSASFCYLSSLKPLPPGFK